MNPIRLSLTIPAAKPPRTLAPAITLFHRFIQQALVEGLLIDVADYRHVPAGPGVLLIGHDVDYGIGEHGLTVTRKRQEGVSAADQLRDAFRMAFGAVRAIESDGGLDLTLGLGRFEVTVADRLRTANTADGAAAVRAELEPVIEEVFGAGATVTREGAADPRSPVAFSVVLPAPAGIEAALAKLPDAPAPRIPYAAEQSEWDITAEDLRELREAGKPFVLVDVRERAEFETVNLGGRLIPLATLDQEIGSLDPDAHIVVHCKAGGRGAEAVKKLRKAGFADAFNLRGGILAWIDRIDPSLPRY